MTWTQEQATAEVERAHAVCVTCDHVRHRHVGCWKHYECCDEEWCFCDGFVDPAQHKGDPP